jgi:hypothetical protein
VNVAAEHPEVVAELAQDLDDFLNQRKTQWEHAPEVELDEMRQHQLRALGYVIEPARRKKDRNGDGKPDAPDADEAGGDATEGDPTNLIPTTNTIPTATSPEPG